MPAKRKTYCAGFWLAISPLLFVAPGEQKPKTLSPKDARHLVYEALPREMRQLPGLELAAGNPEANGQCLTFDILWANPGPGSVHVDFYAVDLQTATLWRGVLYELVVHPRVARLQRDLRRRLGTRGGIGRESIDRSPCRN